ncbi:MAG: hypothetical protein M1337_03005 [Actinobacteria bacterium]|nr:hypothetical protein [Actinomycetota bacterium]
MEAHGRARGRTYTLSARVYRSTGRPSDYVHQAGFDPIQQEQMVLKYVSTHGSIRRRDAMDLCRIDGNQASYLLRKLARAGKLTLVGRGKGAMYVAQ